MNFGDIIRIIVIADFRMAIVGRGVHSHGPDLKRDKHVRRREVNQSESVRATGRLARA